MDPFSAVLGSPVTVAFSAPVTVMVVVPRALEVATQLAACSCATCCL